MQGCDPTAHMQSMAMMGHMYNMLMTLIGHTMAIESRLEDNPYQGHRSIEGGQKRARSDLGDEGRPRARRHIGDADPNDIDVVKGDFKSLGGSIPNCKYQKIIKSLANLWPKDSNYCNHPAHAKFHTKTCKISVLCCFT